MYTYACLLCIGMHIHTRLLMHFRERTHASVCSHVFIHACMRNDSLHTHVYTRSHTCMRACIHKYIDVCLCVTCAYTYAYIHMYLRIWVYVHTCTYMLSSCSDSDGQSSPAATVVDEIVEFSDPDVCTEAKQLPVPQEGTSATAADESLCVYACIYIHTYIHTYRHTHTHIAYSICSYTYIYTPHMHICMSIYAHRYTCTYAYNTLYIHSCTYTYTCTCT
jgi:hypothetical protein